MNRRMLENYSKMRQRLLRAITEAEELESSCEEYLSRWVGETQTLRRVFATKQAREMLEALRALNRQLRQLPLPPAR